MDAYKLTLLALTGWREAAIDGPEGMRAVMHVIRNRVDDWKQEWDHVITGRNQFAAISVKGDPMTVRWPRADDPLWHQAWELANRIFYRLDGQPDDPGLCDPTGHALYYANLETATSGWFRRNIVERPDEHPQVMKIGHHVFFK